MGNQRNCRLLLKGDKRFTECLHTYITSSAVLVKTHLILMSKNPELPLIPNIPCLGPALLPVGPRAFQQRGSQDYLQ